MSVRETSVARAERIEAEAGEWALAMSEGELSVSQKEAMRTWESADPEHAAALQSMKRTLSALDGVDAREFSLPSATKRRAPAAGRRLIVGAVAALAAALLVVVAIPYFSAPAGQEHQTALAETRTITLDDGSVLTLGADSRIAVSFSQTERRVLLESGEAFFEVAHDESRPFYVVAGDTQVRVVGTKFNVNRSASGVNVGVTEGVVRVQHTELLNALPRGPTHVLRAGERIELPALALPIVLTPAAVAVTSAASPPGGWRDGWLTYNDEPLSQFIDDVNRYYGPGVSLSDPALAELRVTASFRPSDIAQIVDVLDAALPIGVRQQPNGAYIFTPEPR